MLHRYKGHRCYRQGLALERWVRRVCEGALDGKILVDLKLSMAAVGNGGAMTYSKDEGIELLRISIRELLDFQKSWAHESCAPINYRRAIAHVNNPFASMDDVALIIAVKNGECIGYLGLLPGILQDSQASHPVSFGTTFFVAPEFRRYGVALKLIGELKRLGKDVLIAGLSDDAAAIYRAIRWKQLPGFSVCEIAFSKWDLGSTPLRAVRKLLKLVGIRIAWLDSAIKSIDNAFNSLMQRWAYRGVKQRALRNVVGFEIVEVPRVIEEEFDGLSIEPEEVRFLRNAKLVNWMLDFQWRDRVGQHEEIIESYRFSGLCQKFQFVTVRIRDSEGQKCVAYVILSCCVRDGVTTLKVLDVKRGGGDLRRLIGGVICLYASRFDADRIELSDECRETVLECFPSSCRVVRRDRQNFFYAVTADSVLNSCGDRIVFSYCDGDRGFT